MISGVGSVNVTVRLGEMLFEIVMRLVRVGGNDVLSDSSCDLVDEILPESVSEPNVVVGSAVSDAEKEGVSVFVNVGVRRERVTR